MELRILIDNRSKQFTGISRDKLSYCQDGIHYKFPILSDTDNSRVPSVTLENKAPRVS